MPGSRLQCIFLPVFLILAAAAGAGGQVFHRVVDPRGGGDHTTIQAAIDAAPSNPSTRTLVFIREGVYREKVVIPPAKTNLSLIGDPLGEVVITWDDHAGKNGLSTANSYTLWADANGLYLENITIRNAAGPVGQAVALRTTGDSMVFRSCTFAGFQDTYYAHKRRQYNYRCRIEGATDFIFGDATTVFDSCTVCSVPGGQYITAPADAKTITAVAGGNVLHGLLFRYCQLTAAAGVSAQSCYLGRPWQPAASSVFIECTLGPHVRPEGWSVWSGNNHTTGFFAEYNSRDEQGGPADVSRRVAWSYQLDQPAADSHYNLPFFFRKEGRSWDPLRVMRALPAPGNPLLEGTTLHWNSVDGALGYVVHAGARLGGFTAGTAFALDSIPGGETLISVRAVSSSGATGKSVSLLATCAGREAQKGELILQEGGKVRFATPLHYRLFTLRGELAGQGNGSHLRLEGYPPGIYVLRATSPDGRRETEKIVVTNEQ